jgi:hypothetical protein
MSEENKKKERETEEVESEFEPDWSTPCSNCGAVPTVPATGLCGPCTFGEAKTIDGNW